MPQTSVSHLCYVALDELFQEIPLECLMDIIFLENVTEKCDFSMRLQQCWSYTVARLLSFLLFTL